ncbi:MAG TPA: hypothetical protein VF532_23260 [Candidatus Angelobacter sp.]
MPFNRISVALGLAAPVLQATLATVMVHLRLNRQVPAFFLYTCFSLLASLVQTILLFSGDNNTFFNLVWAMEAIYACIGLLAMYESFRKVLRVYYFSKAWFFLAPLATILAILSVSTWALHQHTPIQTTPIGKFYLFFYLSADYMRAGFFGLFVVLVFLWQAPWQRYTFGIMKGFGLFSIVGMLADLLRSEFGTKWDFFFSYAPSVAYILGCLIWLGAFLATDERTRPAGPVSVVDLDEILELLSKLTKAIK